MRRLPLVGCQQFVVIPGLNVWNEGQPGTSQTFMRSASRLLRSATRATIMLSLKQTDLRMTLLDEVAPHETMLVSMDETQRINLLRAHPGLRVVPVSKLTPMWLRRFLPVPSVAISAAAKVAFEVKIVDGVTGAPMEGIDVVDLTGPGVGVVSTYPGGYAAMDGTAMACPAITGSLARTLGKHARILTMSRDQKRSDAIVQLALKTASELGFGASFEGAGLLV
jgi:subtilisin family serine protease